MPSYRYFSLNRASLFTWGSIIEFEKQEVNLEYNYQFSHRMLDYDSDNVSVCKIPCLGRFLVPSLE